MYETTTQAPDGVDERTWAELVDLVRGRGLAVLSGAGLSTESGIPDYRGPDGERRITPMTAAELLATVEARRRYWARSFAGWRRFARARPNEGHRVVARLQDAGVLGTVITQNVDGLHQQAGSSDVLELHGSLEQVVCTSCGEHYRRTVIDEWLTEANPTFDRDVRGEIRPDGDVVIPEELAQAFHLVACVVCGSDKLKPDVVMFGESVPKPLVEQCFGVVEASRGLLVLGSSLMVMSGYRFVRRAARLGLPVAVLTTGQTRAEAETTIKLDSPLGLTLTRLEKALGQ
ncbi:Sir2 family NAD-dependent protein deacetylase [Luteipulveratus flavus]|uniref:protein acetyllysine N-acetyltransferase n=1 Tax=Luteipulveratus flavus TaxID=3031728 RepID=A0ABT6C8I8_9MICO|nr:Sir2 family NAD-dependent protein deacetylase [Luteipulveratus sp. YIM 133296]MDF8265248.1 Sir2 family NAD-dependent protein deacetylase [Luteipulveratus sp. YIM 133296]